MSDCCQFQPLLTAYHDRELDDAARRRIDRHLRDCPTCAAELASMRDLSARIATRAAAIDDVDSSAALARMHLAVDRTAAAAAEPATLPLLRTAGLLGALAASILIVGGVWLLDARRTAMPTDAGMAAAPNDGPAFAIAPDWERVAMTLRAEPRPGLMGDSPLSPHYADAIQWMLDGLLPADAPTEGKPWAQPRPF